jgi:hypothetical protein
MDVGRTHTSRRTKQTLGKTKKQHLLQGDVPGRMHPGCLVDRGAVHPERIIVAVPFLELGHLTVRVAHEPSATCHRARSARRAHLTAGSLVQARAVAQF